MHILASRSSRRRLLISHSRWCVQAGNILTLGAYWGEDVIVTSHALRDLRPASALTYVEVATLTRADLFAVLDQFEDSRTQIRQAAMRIAMQRAIKIIAEYMRARRDLQLPSPQQTQSRIVTALHQARNKDSAMDFCADPTMILRDFTASQHRAKAPSLPC